MSPIDDKIKVTLDGLERCSEDQCTQSREWSNLVEGFTKENQHYDWDGNWNFYFCPNGRTFDIYSKNQL